MPYELQLMWAKWQMIDRVVILANLFYILQIADALTTYYALKLGGSEANPVVRKLMDAIGVLPAMLAFKALSIAAVYFGAYSMGADVLMLWCVFYVVVVIWNVAQINKLRSQK